MSHRRLPAEKYSHVNDNIWGSGNGNDSRAFSTSRHAYSSDEENDSPPSSNGEHVNVNSVLLPPPPSSSSNMRSRTAGKVVASSSPDVSEGLHFRYASVEATNAAAAAADHIDMNSLTLMEEVLLLGLHDRKGSLSVINDSISYVLRGCIIIELALRGRIRTLVDFPQKHPAERHIEVIDGRMTGEVLLDETLKYFKSESHSIAGWIDLLSGETWNPMKIGFQLRQVRQRIAKGLVDKGVLRSEKKSFLIFDMPTHPLADTTAKHELVKRIYTCLLNNNSSSSSVLPSISNSPSDFRMIILIVCAYSAKVLEKVLRQLSYQQRKMAICKAQQWMDLYGKEDAAGSDIIAAVFTVFSKMDTLIL